MRITSPKLRFSSALLQVSTAAEYEPLLAGMVEPLVALHPACWRHGYAPESLAATVRHAFSAEGRTILAVHDVPNVASARMLTKMDFVALSEVPGPKYRLRTYVLAADTSRQWRDA